jgi:hypothetical protein
LELFPLDVDVYSTEIPTITKECTLEGDLSSLYFTARSLLKFQAFFGLIPNLMWKGENAEVTLYKFSNNN